MTWGQQLHRRAAEICEHIAETEFAPEVALKHAEAAAALGYMSCEIAPSRPVDVRGTGAMRSAEEVLRGQRLTLDWQIRRDAETGLEFAVMVLGWRGAEINQKPGPVHSSTGFDSGSLSSQPPAPLPTGAAQPTRGPHCRPPNPR